MKKKFRLKCSLEKNNDWRWRFVYYYEQNDVDTKNAIISLGNINYLIKVVNTTKSYAYCLVEENKKVYVGSSSAYKSNRIASQKNKYPSGWGFIIALNDSMRKRLDGLEVQYLEKLIIDQARDFFTNHHGISLAYKITQCRWRTL